MANFRDDLGDKAFPEAHAARRDVLMDLAASYDFTFRLYGATPKGVLWVNADTQTRRFAALLDLLDPADAGRPVSINDLGCGYGAFRAFLRSARPDLDDRYTGYDLTHRVLDRARADAAEDPHARFLLADRPAEPADYGFASGIFGFMDEIAIDVWEPYVAETLEQLAAASIRGFAFNMLNKRVFAQKQGLYYADPERWRRFCAERFGAETWVRTDYLDNDFTVYARLPAKPADDIC